MYRYKFSQIFFVTLYIINMLYIYAYLLAR